MTPSPMRAFLLAFITILVVFAPAARVTHAQATLLPGFNLSHTSLDPFAADVWPGDFNRDGITDLAGASFGGPGGFFTSVAIGIGDGTFRDPILSAATLTPWAVGDVNGDGRIDVIGIDHARQDGPPSLYVLAGNGDGTFGQQQLVDAAADQPFTFAVVADFNADGRRDIIAGQLPDRIFVYPGNGNLTFAPRHQLVAGGGPADAVHGDFNGDGRRDLVVANRTGESISVFVNDGGLLFRRSEVALAGPATDITARDLNGDGPLDLVVSSTEPQNGVFGAGRVLVLRGNGNGTFNAPATYDTGRGAVEIVVGDFSRDGRTDILTANRSGTMAACGGAAATFDTISLLTGRSDGTFAPAIHFSLEPTNEPFNFFHVGTVTSLNTSDLNRDGHQDVVTSQGAVLLSRAPAANRVPVPEADFDTRHEPQAFVIGRSTDPDHHALTFTWTDSTGAVVATGPSECVQLEAGDNAFTVTVDDGQGGRASATNNILWPMDDALMITAPEMFGSGNLFADTPYTVEWFAYPNWFTSFGLYYRSEFDGPLTAITECQNLAATSRSCVWQRPEPGERQLVVLGHRPPGRPTALAYSRSFIVGGAAPGTLPGNWDQATIGDTVLGAASHDNGTFTVKGSGADIWGTSDELHFASLLVKGDFDVVARVGSVENVDKWTKAGLMIRDPGDAGAAHASVFATPGRGLAFQRRRTAGGTSVSTAGPLLTAPVWLRLVRFGQQFTAYYRRTPAEAWTRIGSDTIPMFEIVSVGLAVSSHVDGRIAAATFDNVSITPPRAWQAADVSGASTVFGGSHLDSGGRVTVSARGADIWGTSDEFRFVYLPMSGDGSIVARVASIQNTHAWAKAAVMIRETTSPGSTHAMTLVSAARGLALQYRPITNGTSAGTPAVAGTAPRWVRLVRQGNTFISSMSSDGTTWREIGRASIVMGTNVLAGLAVTSHAPTHTTGVFDNITIVP